MEVFRWESFPMAQLPPFDCLHHFKGVLVRELEALESPPSFDRGHLVSDPFNAPIQCDPKHDHG